MRMPKPNPLPPGARACAACKERGVVRIATRIVDGHGPLCTPCTAKVYQPIGIMSPVTVAADPTDDEVEEYASREERKPWRLCQCGCGAPLPNDYGVKALLPGHSRVAA